MILIKQSQNPYNKGYYFIDCDNTNDDTNKIGYYIIYNDTIGVVIQHKGYLNMGMFHKRNVWRQGEINQYYL